MEEERYHNIEAYLSGTMSDEALTTFDAELSVDVDLKEEVTLYKAINFHLTGVENDQETFVKSAYKQSLGHFVQSEEGQLTDTQLKTIGDRYHRSAKKKNKGSITKSRTLYLILSSAAVFAFIFITVLNKKASGTDLYASYFNPKELPSFTTRGDGGILLAKATSSFAESRFPEALDGFNTYLKEQDAFNPLVYIYTGLIQAEQGDIEKAIAQFELLENANTIDKSKALWYKALTYLKFEKKTIAKKVLGEIIENPANYKFKEAQELIKKL